MSRGTEPDTDLLRKFLVLQVIESILDDDNDMQDMYLGRRAAVEALAKQQVASSTLWRLRFD